MRNNGVLVSTLALMLIGLIPLLLYISLRKTYEIDHLKVVSTNFKEFFLIVSLLIFSTSLAIMNLFTLMSKQKFDRKALNLDRREIRRSILITLTTIYIMTFYFYFTNPDYKDVLTTVTGIYAVIVVFYFASRSYEMAKEIKNAEELLKIQYVLGEIDEKEFEKKMNKIKNR